MCGIAGLARTGGLAPDDANSVTRMLNAEIRRGPDGEGLWCGPDVALGHRRLSIIDLSAAGTQPMANEDGSVRVTFNGEIYNYRELHADLAGAGHIFRSQTDTEVIVHGYEQWGIEGLLGRLRGMFAFGLYDMRRGLILARDRLGIKPLYYAEKSGLVVFASEVRALLQSGQIPADRDRKAMTGFLMLGAVPQPRTIIKGVRCLPPGSWVECSSDSVVERRYWDLRETVSTQTTESDDQLGLILNDVVKRHLISDVPLGVFLSGGVDSAALVALTSRVREQHGTTLSTLTVVFDEHQYSEASPAAAIARRFNTDHREIRVTSADFHNELPKFLAAMDQPTNDGVNSWFVSKAAREAGLTVVLSGLGGDEVFWGYKHYRRLANGFWIGRCPGAIRDLLAGGACAWGRLRGRENWMRAGWLRDGFTSDRMYLMMRGFFAPEQIERLMDATPAELKEAVEETFGLLAADKQPSPGSVNYLEMKRYLHDQLLRDTDVFSMAHSIEARVPFLDHVLVERLWNTSPEKKLDGRVNKPLLVRAVADRAVAEAGARPKRGFTFPMARWLNASAGEMLEIAESGSLARGAVRECWKEFAAGRMHWSRAWALTVVGAGA